MTRYRRWNELLELLAAEGQLQVEEAAKALGVSEATVRRDLDELARQQMLTRIRGGAVAQGVTYDLPLRYKSERHPSEKQRIAAVAAALVRAGPGRRPERRHHHHRGGPGPGHPLRPELAGAAARAHRRDQRAEHRDRAGRPHSTSRS